MIRPAIIIFALAVSFTFSTQSEAVGTATEDSASDRLSQHGLQGDYGLADSLALAQLPKPSRNSDVALSNGALREMVADLNSGALGPWKLSLEGDAVRVEVVHHLTDHQIESLVTSLGGSVYGTVPGILAEATVPISSLVALEATDGVEYVRPPLAVGVPIGDPPTKVGAAVAPQGQPIIGQEVGKMNADEWHAAGITGHGVKVGIIDGFDGGAWNVAQAAGEVPSPAGTFCRFMGSNCDVFGGGTPHGVAVAEIIHEMAPNATLYLASVWTASDLQAAVNYFANNGVDIISRSETAEYDGPGNGTGPIAGVVNNAVSQGMVWANAAGNAAGDGADWAGSYWRGEWSDPDTDGFMNFSGPVELLPFDCGFVNGLRWDDWGSGNPTDYDLFIFDDPFGLLLKTASVDSQGFGSPPLETVFDDFFFCDPNTFDIDFLAIGLFEANDGADDVLEFLTNTTIDPSLSSNPYSAGGPMSDSANPGVLSVGAIDPPGGTTIAGYSSWGPTNDGRMKPDVSAAACVSSYSYFPECFNGTSAATPAASGAAALVLSSSIFGASSIASTSPSALANYLRGSTVDRGAAGSDNVYGAGELILGTPPQSATPTATPAPTPSPTASTTKSATPAVTPSKTPTPAASTPVSPVTPTPTPAGVNRIWGDINCSGSSDPVDSLGLLRYDAGLTVNSPASCPDVGDSVFALGGSKTWGNVDCTGGADPIDALKVLRHDAGLAVNQPADCPAIGQQVLVS